ncbi:MAG: helix-turn-helix domain-containing protein [Burkholderiales bacterium]|nr:helix-turn-helix domain-containing protein [Burkholderiales bacterium]
MKTSKRKKLEAAGWKVGSAAEFLKLTEAEEMLVNMKLALAASVKARRQELKLTQQELAQRIGSSQSRVAKMEVADPSVSMELLVRSLASLGASPTQIGKIIGTRVGTKKRGATRKQRRLVTS